jgi:hypothetical protein
MLHLENGLRQPDGAVVIGILFLVINGEQVVGTDGGRYEVARFY